MGFSKLVGARKENLRCIQEPLLKRNFRKDKTIARRQNTQNEILFATFEF